MTKPQQYILTTFQFCETFIESFLMYVNHIQSYPPLILQVRAMIYKKLASKLILFQLKNKNLSLILHERYITCNTQNIYTYFSKSSFIYQ